MSPKPIPLPQFTSTLIARFCRHLKRRGSCLLWQGTCHRCGYGYFRVRGKRYRTHRIVYFLTRGIDPGNLDVCHTCDCPGCCEPSHLFLGTQADNNHDMVRKRRNKSIPHPCPQPGVINGNAKLTDAAVRIIRTSTESNVALARQYGVSDMIISLVKRHKRWTHIT